MGAFCSQIQLLQLLKSSGSFAGWPRSCGYRIAPLRSKPLLSISPCLHTRKVSVLSCFCTSASHAVDVLFPSSNEKRRTPSWIFGSALSFIPRFHRAGRAKVGTQFVKTKEDCFKYSEKIKE